MESIMSKSVNHVMVMGRLTNDVEVKATSTGKQVATFSLAVDRQGEGTDFFEVTAWEKLADILGQYTSKGSRILVQGQIGQQTWEDKETGKKRSKVVITARDVTLLDSKSEGVQRDKVAPVGDEPVNLDDIPF